jgi:hypothetical protein
VQLPVTPARSADHHDPSRVQLHHKDGAPRNRISETVQHGWDHQVSGPDANRRPDLATGSATRAPNTGTARLRWGLPTMIFTLRTRRLLGLLQLAGVLVSLGVGLQVSRCPPGMDSGMDMPMTADAGDAGHQECPFMGSPNEQGDMSCPLAVGGIGPCGTSSVAPARQIVDQFLGAPSMFIETPRDSGRSDGFRAIHLPPPRA